MPRTPATDAQLRETALALADVARTPALAWFRHARLAAASKDGHRFDPVTEGDRAVEDALRAELAQRRPEDSILGEERGLRVGRSGLTWVLDPIDGTRGYLAGAPTWGVLIAVAEGAPDAFAPPVLGVIDQPFIGERFYGGPDGAWTTGPTGRRTLATRAARPLSEAIVLSTFPEVGTTAERDAFHAVASRARLTRYGLDCYGYALLAHGLVDLVIEAGLAAYDVAAPHAVITAAGGVVTDWQGGPGHMGGRILAAANPQIHAEALEILGSTAPDPGGAPGSAGALGDA